ncbi:MAG TPA: SNF2 helicase associated domain-containing protein [Candidatus Lachnoclostridium stercorigallinarum]|uniref:SNF2 helicase associated domain-containing protein n=1 Tax=Candidatus Lachnoclostridium stercorigallinarum TaxID=2838634 RepID=A0A9D2K6A8_9FIRM|nr:SNF2 helicase associated domain-containing protein [Candidatus Lachnoclostridium stercorigallinarum]
MTITEFSSSTFWKGETGIKATVSDSGRSYRSSLYLKNGQVFDYSCSCADGRSYKGMCPHCAALLAYYQTRRKEENSRSVFTSQEIRGMIREYTNREVADILREEEGADVVLRPRLLFKSSGLELEFEVGRERFYILRDLPAFGEAVDNGTLIRYGKQFSFHHSLSAFTAGSRPMAEFLMDLLHTYRDYYAHFHRSGLAVPSFRSIQLNKGDADRFFDLVMGQILETEDSRGQRRKLLVTEDMPRLEIRAERSGRDGISLTMPENLTYFKGESAIYLTLEDCLCRCAGEKGRILAVFFDRIRKSPGSGSLEVNDRDLPLFYERVVRTLEPYLQFQSEDVRLEDYRPQELKAQFAFDCPAPGEVVLHPTLSYGDFSFHPIEDEKVPRTVCRDVPGEFRVSQAITRYFKYREESGSDPVIRDDEEAVYRLLTEGIPEFRTLGEVLVSERMKKLRVLPPPTVSVGVSGRGNWLELKVDAEGMSRQELLKILDSYRQKKKYYRLKTGEFLELGDGGLLTVAEMLDGLGLTKAQMSEEVIRLPGYRAFYLDSILEARRGMSVYRDRMFKTVIRGMKAVEDSDFEVPESFCGELREYQKLGYKWMKTLDELGFGGILADDMGLGKTVQVIALLLDERERRTEQKPSLIVCPASLVYNWENELEKFGPSLKVLLVTGNAAQRREAASHAGEYDVVITSYDLLRRDLELYGDLEFRYQIIDEAQYIKNAGTLNAKAAKAVSAVSRFALTGTPIENHLGELWSIFDYLMPGFLFSYQKFRKEYEIPVSKDGDRKVLERLHQLIGPFILRRLKSQVLKELPEKLETVVYSRAEGMQKELYSASAALLKEKLESGGFEQDRFQVLAALTRLRQICCHPSLCYTNYKEGSAKLETCVDLIRNGIAGGHRILLFSQFTSMLEIIGERLEKEKISCYRLTGDTPKEERIRLAGTFGQDEVMVFLISLKAGGTGLNLTAADMVIHYDPWWNVAAQNQATDRAHRIGQDRKVTVFKLIMKDTVEENMLRLQQMKQNLAEGVIAEGTVELSSLTGRDVMRLLEG